MCLLSAGARERLGINISLCSHVLPHLARFLRRILENREKNLNSVSRAPAYGDKMRTICHIAKFTGGRVPTSLIPYFDKTEFEFLRVRRVEYFQPQTEWQLVCPTHTHIRACVEEKREFLFHLLNPRLLVIRA